MSTDDVVSISDDKKILKWNLVNSETKDLGELPQDFHPTDIHWYPRGGGPTAGGGGKKGPSQSVSGGGQDLFLVASAEGKLQLMSGKNGRVEKNVEAHRGACLAARWSHDGAGIVTGGEDGAVKIWSRSGMLRSTLAQNAEPVYALSWSPDSQSVLYASGSILTIKALAPNSKPLQVNLCQMLLFLHQLTHNMTTDCSLNYKFNTWKFQAQIWGEHVVYRNCF